MTIAEEAITAYREVFEDGYSMNEAANEFNGFDFHPCMDRMDGSDRYVFADGSSVKFIGGIWQIDEEFSLDDD